MAVRYDGFFVVLDKNLSEADAQVTIAALHQIKGVIAVEPHKPHTMDEIAGRARAVVEIKAKLLGLVNDLKDTI